MIYPHPHPMQIGQQHFNNLQDILYDIQDKHGDVWDGFWFMLRFLDTAVLANNSTLTQQIKEALS